MPKVAFLVPTARERWINEVLLAIRNQTLTDIEIIIAPAYKSPVIEDHMRKDSRIKFFDRRSVTYCGETLNRMVDMTDSEILITSFDDDMDYPHKAEFVYNFMQANGSDILVCGYDTMNESGRKVGEFIPSGFDVESYLKHGQNMPLFSGGFRKSTCPKWRSDFYALGDYAFFYEAHLKGLKIHSAKDKTCCNRVWDGQHSRTDRSIFHIPFWDAERARFKQVFGVETINR